MVRPSRNGETSEEGASRRAWRDIGRRPGPHHGPTGSRNSPVRRGHPRRVRTGGPQGGVPQERARHHRRAAQSGRGQAPRAPRGSRQGRPQRRGDARAARCEHGRQARRCECEGRRGQEGCAVRRALSRDDRPGLRDPGGVRQRRVTRRTRTRTPTPTIPGPARFDGPLVNQIPEPDRSVDNSTVLEAELQPGALREDCTSAKAPASSRSRPTTRRSRRAATASTARSPTGCKVQYNEARYGRSNGFPCAGNVCSNTWNLVQDAANKWYADQLAAGRPAAEVNAELATFDKWDRYDYDTDGNFNEPDGYIDHFQIVHAGGDQADGDPTGRARTPSGPPLERPSRAPAQGPAGNPDGGNQIGNSGIWIADYTIQPENGGRSVFFHEYGHDLGLPDDYNIISGGDNNNEHWTLMAQSRLGAKGEQFIGDRAGDLGAWNKLQLGWLDYETLVAGPGVGGNRTMKLGPEEYNNKDPQAVVVVLPKKEVVTQLGAPSAGAKQWYSGTGNGLENTMTRNGDPPGHGSHADLQGALGHRGLRARPLRLRLRRGIHRRRHDVDGARGLDHQAGRGQRDRRHAGDVRPRDVRPVDLRRQDDRPAVQVLQRPGGPGQLRHGPGRHLRRRDRDHGGRHHRLRRRRGDQPERLDPGGLELGGGVDQPAVRQLLHRRTSVVRVVRQVPQDRAVLLRATSTPSPTRSTTTRTSRVS